MKPGGGGAPTGPIADLINASFGSYENFRAQFETAANTAFGSGWAWLVWTPNGLVISKSSNADSPIVDESVRPLLTVVSLLE
jgi:superoxide dismutase, Fe-Mn family